MKESKQSKKDKKTKENMLCAIIALMKELDVKSLKFVISDAEKKMSKLEEKERKKAQRPSN